MNDDELEELFAFGKCNALDTTATPTSTSKLRNSVSVNTAQNEKSTKQNEPCTSLLFSDALPLPVEIESKLFDYQKDGVKWLYEKHRKARGCLLADEMGLGKTVQVAAFLGFIYTNKLATSTIIIVPPTLLQIWELALQQWGNLKPPLLEVIHNDPKAKRLQRWRKLTHGTACVFLTTYGVLRQDSGGMSVRMVDYVIIDEAHLIKDASTQVFKSLMALSSRHRIAITGTPLMNSFEDLWSIFQFIDGSILGSTRAEFRSINTILLRGNERDALKEERLDAEKQLELVRAMIQPHMLRRDKRQLQMLSVGKRDLIIWVRLNETQEQQYMSLVGKDHIATTFRNEDRSQPLVLLTSLMQICNHPWFSLSDEAFRDALQNPLELPVADTRCGDALNSSKITSALALVVKCIREQRKTLVFSRSKRLLELFAVALKFWWIDFARIDGDVSPEARFNTLQAFSCNDRVWVCLLTTQVGGVGLTVETASAVILLNPSWNPSTDAQAIDRVHRIGQTRDVIVYRLITCGTVEEKVYRNQVFKVMAAKQGTSVTQSESENGEFYRYFTRMQLRSMFEVGVFDRSETAEQLDALHPNAVPQEERDALTSLPFVSAVTDNSCVYAEPVAEAEEKIEIFSRNTPRRGGDKRKRQPSLAHSASKTLRQEMLSQNEVSDILIQLEEENSLSQTAAECLASHDNTVQMTIIFDDNDNE